MAVEFLMSIISIRISMISGSLILKANSRGVIFPYCANGFALYANGSALIIRKHLDGHF